MQSEGTVESTPLEHTTGKLKNQTSIKVRLTTTVEYELKRLQGKGGGAPHHLAARFLLLSLTLPGNLVV